MLNCKQQQQHLNSHQIIVDQKRVRQCFKKECGVTLAIHLLEGIKALIHLGKTTSLLSLSIKKP